MNSHKQKGNRFERIVSEWMTRVSGIKYRRTPNSGAMHQDFPFDIMKIGHEPSVFDGVGNECKDHKRLTIPEWIKQIEDATDDAGIPFGYWFIAFNIKGKVYFLLNQEYFEELLQWKKKQMSS